MPAGPTVVADYGHRVGENPLWDSDGEFLYWCGIYEGGLYRYDPAADAHHQVYAGDPIGGFTLQSDGSVLLFQADGAVRVLAVGEGTAETVIPAGGTVDARFNDVVADPRGRVLCGTYPQDGRLGTLYRLDRDGSLTPLVERVALSNGLGFSPDCRTLYYAESEARTIHRFDYDEETGDLSAGRPFVELGDLDAKPDGLTVDAGGDVWVAHADGGRVVRYSPDGHERGHLSVPTPFVSSVAFGDPDLDALYVTTGGGDERSSGDSLAGALFRAEPDATGREPFRSRIAR